MHTPCNTVYLISDKPGAGKTTIGLQFIKELLVQEPGRSLCYFEPVYNNLTLNESVMTKMARNNVSIEQLFTYNELIQSYAHDSMDILLTKIIERYTSIQEASSNPFILIEGFDPLCGSLFLDINHNITLAKNLNAPIILIIDSFNDSVEQVALRALSSYKTLKKQGLFIASLIINRLSISHYNKLKITLPNFFPKETVDKIDLVLDTDSFEINTPKILDKIARTASNLVTPQRFRYTLLKQARSDLKTVVLAEGDETRVQQAAVALLNQHAVKLQLLGNAQNIRQALSDLGLSKKARDNVNIIDFASVDTTEYAQQLVDLRKNKGLTLAAAQELMKDVSYYATMMVYKGAADAMVSGYVHTTAHTVLPALQFIKTKVGVKSVSSLFFMCLDNHVRIYADCGIVVDPSVGQLAEIAILAAQEAKKVGIEPRIAMLSYSTGSSAQSDKVDKILEATELIRKLEPTLLVEGPLQYDAAVDPQIALKKMPASVIAGHASVLIFPDLNAGNIAYKAVQREAGAVAIGPVLMGLNKPINDLSRGSTVEDIINTVLISAIQAQHNPS